MGPKTAGKVVEKVAPKDEAQVFYVNVKLTAPAPTVSPPLVASASASVVSGEPHASSVPKSPKKQTKKEDSESVVQAAPVAPVVEEMQEVSFEIIANLICRTDIMIDYVRRQLIKVIQDKLAAEDPDKKMGEALRTKLKNLQVELGTKTSADLILRDPSGTDVVFKEVRHCLNCVCYIKQYKYWSVTENSVTVSNKRVREFLYECEHARFS